MNWYDDCGTCKFRPCRCSTIKMYDRLHASVQAFVDCSTGDTQRRWRLIAQVVDRLPMRLEDLQELVEDMDRGVCSMCDRTSHDDVCEYCIDASICPHECRRDECLFCSEGT